MGIYIMLNILTGPFLKAQTQANLTQALMLSSMLFYNFRDIKLETANL